MDNEPASTPSDSMIPDVTRRMLTLQDVADALNVSHSQAYALVRNKELVGVKIGGRGQWRVLESELDAFIERAHAETAQWIADHPFTGSDADDVAAGS